MATATDSIRGHNGESRLDASGSLEAWLARSAGSRNLSLPLRGDDSRTAAVRYLVATLAGEFSRYGEILSAARAAVAENAASLRAVVSSAEIQQRAVRAGSENVARAAEGASRVAAVSVSLQRLAAEAAHTRDEAETKLEGTATLLESLDAAIADAHRPIEHMAASVATVRSFVETLARIARHAKLLSVNATIEAAHLGSVSRFGIVATEIRRLSESTQTASLRIRDVAGEWHESTERVEAALAAGSASTVAARAQIAVAGGVLAAVRTAFRAFSESVAGIAAASSEQEAAFDSVAEAVEAIAKRTDKAAQAAAAASSIELDIYLERAERTLAGWTYGTDFAERPASDDALSRRIVALAHGEDTHETFTEPDAQSFTAAVNGLVGAANEAQRAILTDIGQASMAVAQNLVAWRTIASSFRDAGSQIDAAGRAIEEATAGARTAVSTSETMRTTFAAIAKQLEDAAGSLGGALARIDEIGEDVIRTESLAGMMSEAAGRARTALAFIVELSAETDLLSLNAAIEASRAGSRGRTFAVVAAEVRRLASTTHEATADVSAIVTEVAAIGENVAAATAATREHTDATSAAASNVHEAVEAMHASFTSTLQQANDVATVAETQAALLESVLTGLREGGAAATRATTDGANNGRAELFHLYSRAHDVAAGRSVAIATTQLRALNERTAVRFESIIDEAIASGRISAGAFDDFSYTEIAGPAISSLGRLFDVSRVPAEGFTPPKYTNAWDAVIDEALCDVLEDAYTDRETPAKIMMAFVDLNGFSIAYPRSRIAAWTGDPAKDVMGNRIKRFVDDDLTLESIRFGMGGDKSAIGRRARYGDFLRAGCTLERPDGVRPWSVVVAARDIGDVFSDILTAVYARGRRLGTIRLARDPSTV